MEFIKIKKMDETYYISIITGTLFALSEILPFIPETGNGFIHSGILILKKIISFSKKGNSEANVLPTTTTSSSIDEIQKKLDEIHNFNIKEMKDIKTKLTNIGLFKLKFDKIIDELNTLNNNRKSDL